MKKVYFFLVLVFVVNGVWGQTNNYFGTSGTLSGSVWSTIPAGPYTSPLNTTGGAIINFQNVTTTITGASITVIGITATANATITTTGGTISNFSNGVIPVDVSTGVVLDFSTQAITTSITAGYIKNGDGTWATSGSTYGGGFTLNAGTLVARGVNAMGGNATPGALIINGGIIAGSANRDFTGKYSGIAIGGDFTFGSSVAPAVGTSNLTFSNNVSLGNSTTRAITIGGTGIYTLGGIISGTNSNLIIGSTAAGTIVLTGANTYSGTTTVNGGTLRLNRTGGTTIPTTNNVIVNGGTFRVSTAQTLNDLTLASGATLTVDAGITLTINGTFIHNGGTISPTGTIAYGAAGVLSYGGSSAQTSTDAEFPSASGPNSLTINNAAGVTLPGSFSRTIAGSLNLNSGTLTVGANTLTIAGTLTRTSGNIDASNASATVAFTNTSALTLPASTFTGTVTNFTLNGAGGVTMSSDISVGGLLTLTIGKIILGDNNLILLSAAPSSLDAGALSSYIVTNGAGVFRRAVGTLFSGSDYFFPVGNSTNRQIATINFGGSLTANNTLAARFITGAPGSAGLPLTESGDNINRTTVIGYWEINSGSATTDPYTGSFNAVGFGDILDYTKLHLLKRDNAVSNWGFSGVHVTTTGSNANAVLQRTGMSGFSQFGVGGEQSVSLPVSLLSFSGYKSGSVNKLQWTTSSEQNNVGFDVQRSLDGVNYTSIGFVNTLAAGGNSATNLNYNFTDNSIAGSKQFYRLRQVDIDNRSRFSNVVLIKGDKPTTIAIDGLFPNPASSTVNVLIAAPSKDKVTVMVTDMVGRTVAQQVANVETGSNTIPLDISRLTNGTYMVKLVCANGCEGAVGKFVKQ